MAVMVHGKAMKRLNTPQGGWNPYLIKSILGGFGDVRVKPMARVNGMCLVCWVPDTRPLSAMNVLVSAAVGEVVLGPAVVVWPGEWADVGTPTE